MLAARWLATALAPSLVAAPLALGGVIPAPTDLAPASSASSAVDSTGSPAADDAVAQQPDFDGDGYADLAAGVPGEGETATFEGAVSVIYGSPAGLSATGNQLWSQDSPGVLDAAEGFDSFGEALGWADFNGDGYDDLAIGVPYEDLGSKGNAGAVNVLYGSSAGLTSTGNQFWTRSSPGVPGKARKGEVLGRALLGRDFDKDGFGDLVIGAPGDGVFDAGAALVLRGGPSGLGSAGNQELLQLQDGPEGGDEFGHTFAAGDFNNDGFADLAIGAPSEDTTGLGGEGAVNVVYGSASGFVDDGNQFWHQASPGVPGDPGYQELLGWSLTVADFNRDKFADLAIGIRFDDVRTAENAGSALVLYGSATGLTATGSQLWNQASYGVLDEAETYDTNEDVVAGDFDGDSYADLAIGFAGEDLGRIQQAGAVNVLYGAPAGLSATGNQFWHQNTAGVEETAESDDYFGSALSRADFNGDGYADLAVGVAGESVGSIDDVGSVNVLYGTAGGLSATGDQLWSQDSPNMLGTSEAGDSFGSVLGER